MTLEERRSSRTDRRRRRTFRRLGLRSLAALAALGLAAGLTVALTRDRAPDRRGPAGALDEGNQISYLVILTAAGDLSQQAETLTLFAVQRSGERPTVLFVPVAALGVIPGQGFEAIGKAMSVGRAPLQRTTVENLLGVRVDHTIALDTETLAGLVDSAGGIVVDVREKLLRPDPAAGGTLLPAFRTGRVAMNGANAVRYLTFRAEGENELDRFPRAQQVWEALFARYHPRPRDLARLMGRLAPATALDATAREVGDFFAAFARAPDEERIYQVLPVTPVGAGGPAEAYAVDEERLAELIEADFAGSRPRPGVGVGAGVEVLNGNGLPEVGAAVAERLVPAGMKIVVSANARSFDFPRTLIIVYADDAPSLALARRVRSLLGVGEIQIGRRVQTIVEVTVVIGHDFPPAKRG